MIFGFVLGNELKPHQIWIEQCEAAQTIKARYGLAAAFDYLVGEKLMNFANAAARHPDFARELPRFVSAVRRMFSLDEIRAHLGKIERAQSEQALEVVDEDDPLRESPNCDNGQHRLAPGRARRGTHRRA